MCPASRDARQRNRRLFGMLSTTRPDAAAHQDQTSREIPLVVISYQK